METETLNVQLLDGGGDSLGSRLCHDAGRKKEEHHPIRRHLDDPYRRRESCSFAVVASSSSSRYVVYERAIF